MLIIGITGGVGSGKSKVLAFLEEQYAATTIQLDQVAYDLQQKGQKVYQEIVKAFGETVLGEDGALNRQYLGEVIFKDERKRVKINALVHPAVEQWVKEDIALKKEQGASLYVIEAALLLEANYDKICDELWYIHGCKQVRQERLKKSRGYSKGKIEQMMAAQKSEEAYRQGCQFVIENSGDFAKAETQIRARMAKLV